jgi:ABC-type transport system involved in cytochrome c biogenesis permease subunit
MGDALVNIARGGELQFAITSYARMADAFKAGDVAGFNAVVGEYRGRLAGEFNSQLQKAGNEQVFNFFQPFYQGMILFVLAGLLAIGFWFAPVKGEWLRRTAFWVCVLGLGVHATGLIWRMVLEGRPPVTNLYSSAIFIGFGATVLGLILEMFWKNSIGLVVASVCAFLSLLIAHHLSLSGDTMEMMRAVLDTNLWLSTHVVVVTLGYASTFVAGFLAILYVVLGCFTNLLSTKLTPRQAAGAGLVVAGVPGAVAMYATAKQGLDIGKSLTKMVYGIVCFATLFSFVGTVLGGIWADQSWGRFWGWDAKENGALMIVIWNAIILHARWGGLVRERGLMACAIFGNIVTAWSWFGVNMLGIGLHSYGFMDSAFKWLVAFALSQVALIALAAQRLNRWKSFRDAAPLPESKVPDKAEPQLA